VIGRTGWPTVENDVDAVDAAAAERLAAGSLVISVATSNGAGPSISTMYSAMWLERTEAQAVFGCETKSSFRVLLYE
jgi:hypothetical protein